MVVVLFCVLFLSPCFPSHSISSLLCTLGCRGWFAACGGFLLSMFSWSTEFNTSMPSMLLWMQKGQPFLWIFYHLIISCFHVFVLQVFFYTIWWLQSLAPCWMSSYSVLSVSPILVKICMNFFSASVTQRLENNTICKLLLQAQCYWYTVFRFRNQFNINGNSSKLDFISQLLLQRQNNLLVKSIHVFLFQTFCMYENVCTICSFVSNKVSILTSSN